MRSWALLGAALLAALLLAALRPGPAGAAMPFTSATATSVRLSAAPSFYAATVLADAPRLHWRLGEASGTTAVDAAGNHPGTYAGTVTRGLLGRSADGDTAVGFAGAGRVSTSASALEYAGRAPFTLEAWTRVDSTAGGDYGRLFSSEATTAAGRQGYNVYRCPASWSGAGTTCFFAERHRDDVGQSVGTGPLALGVWHHLVFTYDGSTMRTYADGAFVGSGASTSDLVSRGSGLTVGAGRNPYTGAVDEVAVYDRALSAARVAAHHERGG